MTCKMMTNSCTKGLTFSLWRQLSNYNTYLASVGGPPVFTKPKILCFGTGVETQSSLQLVR